MRIKSLAFILIGFSIACNNSSTDKAAEDTAFTAKEDSLFSAVQEGHDVGMAKYGKLKRSISEVEKRLDSLSKLPEEKVDALNRKDLMDLQQDLTHALKGMDDWMTNFVMDSAKSNHEQRLKYLESEKEKVTKVREDILNSLQRADSLLKLP